MPSMTISAGDLRAVVPARERILAAAFEAFAEQGFARTSTLDIARRARVSKRDLYAHFPDKQALLTACIERRAEAMRLLPDLPPPTNRQMLAASLAAFGQNLIREIIEPRVITAFRLAIGEAQRFPELAQTLERAGREGARRALVKLLTKAQSRELLGPGEPQDLAAQYFGLLWEGLLISLLLGVTPPPGPDEIARRAKKATDAFLQLHPEPGAG